MEGSSARVTFWGAAQSVTGSMHLVESRHAKVLLDCGLVRGHHGPPHPGGAHFPFDPRVLDAVVLSHAHVDHCGNLPNLVRHGFAGPIYCTAATRDLIAIMLANSARMQEEDAFVHKIVALPATLKPARFGQRDVDQTLEQCVAVPYDADTEIAEGVRLRLIDAGHILGSAMVHLLFSDDGARLTFTGDLGRPGAGLLRDPSPVPAADLILSESTYGGRMLDSPAQAAADFEQIVRRSMESAGKVLVPAFSLGRTQLVVHVLQKAMESGRLPRFPVYVDGPTAAEIADVYRHHKEALDPRSIPPSADGAFLAGANVHYLRAKEESEQMAARAEPCVIIASSGMCEGGRIIRHLKQHLDDPRCSIVLVSYQAPNTPGRRLLERGPTVRLHGRKWNKWADVSYLAGFSGHADREDLLGSLTHLATTTTKVRLVHGEPDQAVLLAAGLRDAGFADVAAPHLGETVSI